MSYYSHCNFLNMINQYLLLLYSNFKLMSRLPLAYIICYKIKFILFLYQI
nr:MAG TPA: hypothetical protein [Caudoviricetes sp.]